METDCPSLGSSAESGASSVAADCLRWLAQVQERDGGGRQATPLWRGAESKTRAWD